MTVTVNVVMYDEVLWQEGHLIGRWSRSMSHSLGRNTRDAAPVNRRKNKRVGARGDLRRGIHAHKNPNRGKHIEIDVSSSVDYTLFVVKGTPGGTRPKTGTPYNIPANYVGKGKNTNFSRWQGKSFDGRKGVFKIKGQSPNNFFERGFDKTSLVHPCLRG